MEHGVMATGKWPSDLYVIRIEYHHCSLVAIGTTIVRGREDGRDIRERVDYLPVVCV